MAQKIMDIAKQKVLKPDPDGSNMKEVEITIKKSQGAADDMRGSAAAERTCGVCGERVYNKRTCFKVAQLVVELSGAHDELYAFCEGF